MRKLKAQHTLHCWRWLIPALLPVALYAKIAEVRSWQPRHFHVPNGGNPENPNREIMGTLHWVTPERLQVIYEFDMNRDQPHPYVWEIYKNTPPRRIGQLPENTDPFFAIPVNTGKNETILYSSLDSIPSKAKLWDCQSQQITDLKGFESLTVWDKYSAGYQSDPNGLDTKAITKIATWNLATGRQIHSISVKTPQGYTCGQIGWADGMTTSPTYAIAPHRQWGVLTLTKNHSKPVMDDIVIPKQVLVFNGTNGHAERIITVANAKEQIIRLTPLPNDKLAIVTKPLIEPSGDTYRGMLYIWDIKTGRRINKVAPYCWEQSPCFSDDGTTYATITDKYLTVEVRATDTHHILRKITLNTPPLTHTVLSMTFAPDGRTLAILENDGHISLWRVR